MAIAMQRSTSAPPPAVLVPYPLAPAPPRCVHTHFLTCALHMPRTPAQGQQWSTLRMIFLMMERGDLADKCDRGDVDAFHGDFDF